MSSPDRSSRYKRLVLTIAAVFLLDRIAKLLAEKLLTAPVTLIPGIIGLRLMKNTGMAFSMLGGHSRLLGLATLPVLALLAWVISRAEAGPLFFFGGGLLLGGAFGNLLDRLLFGQVTDMLEILLFRFAVFNPADVCVCVGCFMMAVSLLLTPGDLFRKGEKENG